MDFLKKEVSRRKFIKSLLGATILVGLASIGLKKKEERKGYGSSTYGGR